MGLIYLLPFYHMSHIDLATQVLYIIVFCLYSLCSKNLVADIEGGKEAEGV